MTSKNIFFILFFFLCSCGRPYNSSYSDASKYGSNGTGTAEFLAAREVVSNRCLSCHAEWSSYTEALFVSQNYVVGGSLSNSILYTKIRGNDVGSSGNMPPSENLSAEEIGKIRTWILAVP